MKHFLLILLTLISDSVFALKEHQLECTPEINEDGFSASITMKQLNTTWVGKITNFKLHSEWNMPGTCKPPSLEGLDIGSHLDQKFYYHESEYEEGCILWMVFASTVSVAAWVYPKEDHYNQSNKLHAECTNT